ncbi:DUF2478 domain-containing protein [Sneathiella sp. P13V-1]|uniref:DUF2478 domain-containing protein n=1 Tax=Sneathiella sp. P13V-1 TaxID=2697366 RepID=UPI00187BB892|nr:DUF2478 domain-containing protein [Sneathiella sp. P13V-1]MBE7635397.1 DUF2478 domain-containing protein [Sneathiella sp. P13V-1]
MSNDISIKAAAMLYPSGSGDKNTLASFVKAVKAKGYSVGGVLQEQIYDTDGTNIGVDAVAIDTEERFPIVRPSKEDIAAGSCGLNRSVLTESSIALRRAISKPVDLLIVEKFGEREQLGEGLADDIMSAMSGGIPVIVAVPMSAKQKWTEFTGGLAASLSPDLTELEDWWSGL